MTKSILSIKAHDGKCASISYDGFNHEIITVGHDGTAKFWQSISGAYLRSFHTTESVFSAVFEKERIFVASSSSNVDSFSTQDSSNVAVMTQFTSDVNHIRISVDNSCFVAGSSDNSAKIVRLNLSEESEIRENVFQGHQGPVISVDLDYDCKMVATASCDGTVAVWRARNSVKLMQFNMLDTVKDVSQVSNPCRLRFSPTSTPGKDTLLAVPLNGQVSLLECKGWHTRGSLIWDGDKNRRLNECIFSQDSRFFVGGTSDGYILSWDIASKDLVSSWSSGRGSCITGLLWHPIQKGVLLFCDESGFWEYVKMDLKEKNSDEDMLSFEDLDEMFDDFDEDELEKKSLASTVKEERDEEEETSDVDPDFDISFIKAKYDGKDGVQTKEGPTETNVLLPQAPPLVTQKRAHPVVRPGATPIMDGVQLLLWNSVGALKKHYDEDGNTDFLEVYFHDLSVSRPILVRPDIIDCAMGDVNSSVILLVSDQSADEDDDLEEDEDRQFMIYVKSVGGAWTPWNTLLPKGEAPLACCLAGDQYAVVLTDRGFIRYFSLGLFGLQSFVESVHGNVVALVSGRGLETPQMREGSIMVALVVEQDNSLMCRLEHIRPGRFTYRGTVQGSQVSDWIPLPLSPGATLTWIGFSDGGVLYSVDSKQCVRRMQISRDPQDEGRFNNPRWCPVLNLRDALDKEFRNTDRYFPVGFMDQTSDSGALTLHCRSSRYPRLVPWPHLTVVPYTTPLCPGQDEATMKLENTFTTLHLIPDWSRDSDKLDLQEKEMLLKLFVNAVTQDQDSKAMALARIMPDSAVVLLARKVAERLRKMILVDRLGELALQKEEEEKMEENGLEDEYQENEDGENKENEKDEKVNEEEDNEEDEEDSISTEELIMEKKSMKTGVKRMMSESTVDRLTKSPSERRSVAEGPIMTESPFKVASKTPTVVSRRGIDVVDKLGISAKKTSPKKSAMVFGNFVPSPSAKVFKIKTKRKSTVVDGSPLGKKPRK